ncbi:MAG: DUF192 domain-containing protein [Steroidobacteraceae bacterium]
MSSSRSLPLEVMRCETFWERTRGMLLRPRLRADQALLIEPCGSIHMIGMRYAIDVVFVDRTGRVIKVCPNVPPFGFAAARRAHAAWELLAGTCDHLDICAGQQLTFVTR